MDIRDYRPQFEQMSVDELWALYTVVDQILAARIVAKKQELDRRLEQLHHTDGPGGSSELSVRASSSGRDRL
ncbi:MULTISPECIES: hypothetical protein [unclassified Bradyrhizobium]|uniref:hypothetical protein n=1 Tax=unclassified Bradyrhizobium TaxID=2631580 RepID=UPI001FF9635E|nr:MULTISPECIES: hypothetical protein [unclassified Bradyrhizobium]MCK1535357.1 hypothetical protein [Bradyrhizobium sp. 176]MCK1559318.1 hypothetical protein [Bradyrhizobium sp. 171]